MPAYIKIQKNRTTENGAVLLYLILVIIVLGIIGAAMVSMYSSSVTSTGTPNFSRRAQLIAESGIRYAQSELAVADDADFKNKVKELHNSTYSFTDGDKFILKLGTNALYQVQLHDVGPKQIILVMPDESPDDTFPDGFNLPDCFQSSDPDCVYLVEYDEFPQAQYLARVQNCTLSGDRKELICDYQDAFHDPETGELVAPGVSVSHTQTISEGGNLVVKRGASYIFSEKDGIVTVNEKAYRYENMICSGQDCTLTNLKKPFGEWKSSDTQNVQPSDFAIFNTEDLKTYQITSTGYAGKDSFETTKTLSYNFFQISDESDEPPSLPFLFTDSWPSDEVMFGNSTLNPNYEGIDGGIATKSNLVVGGAGEASNFNTRTFLAKAKFGIPGSGNTEIEIRDSGDLTDGNKLDKAQFTWTNNATEDFILRMEYNGTAYILTFQVGSGGSYTTVEHVFDQDELNSYGLGYDLDDIYIGNFYVFSSARRYNNNKFIHTYIDEFFFADTAVGFNTNFLSRNEWQSLTSYSAGDVVFPLSRNGHLYSANYGGMSGSLEPQWSNSDCTVNASTEVTGFTIPDGSVLWQEVATIIHDDNHTCDDHIPNDASCSFYSYRDDIVEGCSEFIANTPEGNNRGDVAFVTQRDFSTKHLYIKGKIRFVWIDNQPPEDFDEHGKIDISINLHNLP